MTGLELEDVTAGYGDLIAVRGVTLAVREREIVALLGRNGAGKSTLLGAVSGALPMAAGAVRLDGTDLSARRAHQRVRAGIAFVQQNKRIFHRLTVEENLRLGGYGLGRRDRAGRVGAVLEYFPVLAERRSLRAGALSGGQQQMVAIAQALMPRPRFLLLDEPSSGLAPVIVQAVLDVVRALRDEGMGILLVEQLVDQAMSVADRVAVLEQGAIAMCEDRVAVDHAALRQFYFGRSVSTLRH